MSGIAMPGRTTTNGRGMIGRMQIAFGMVLFVGIGYAVDQWLVSTPWGMILGAVLGMVAIFVFIIRVAREADSNEKAKRK